MKLKRILSLLAATTMIVTAITGAMSVCAETASGECGEDARWSFDASTGILTISGTGDMYTNYVPYDQWGYYQYKDEITKVVVEEGITSISQCAFGPYDPYATLYRDPPIYSKLAKLTLPSSVKSIGKFAFYKTALTSVTLPEGLEEIGDGVFAYTSLSGDLNLPKSLNNLGEYAFKKTNISSVNLNEGMILGGSAFRYCDSLEKVIIPRNIDFYLTSTSNAGRPNCGFAQCDSLEKVIIQGAGTVEIGQSKNSHKNALGEGLFSQCPSLKEIIIDCKDIEYVGSNGSEGSTFDIINNPTFYIYKDSTTEQTLKDAGYLTDDNTVYIADFSKLETAISDAESLETDKYTDDSVSAFNEALEAGKAILEDKTSTQDEVDSAVKAIEDAKNALEEKKEPSSDSSNPSDSSSNPLDSSNPSDSSNNPSDSSNPSGSGQPSNSGSSQPTSAQPATNAPTTAAPKVTPPTATTVVKPAKVKAVKLKAKKKKLNVSWKKVSGATGYEVKAATNSKFTKGKKTVTVKKNKATIKNLKPKKKYFIKVRAYKLANGRKYYGKWSKVVKKKVR